MLFYTYDKSHVDRGTATLRNAVDNAKKYAHLRLAQDYDSCWLSCQNPLNCTTVQSKLIEYTGRYCDSYASDIICTLSDLDAFLRDDDTPEDAHGRWIIGVGLRDHGVDHNAWIMCRLKDTKQWNSNLVSTSAYRKVLALDITDELVQATDGDYYRNREVTLYDITNELYKLAEEDE